MRTLWSLNQLESISPADKDALGFLKVTTSSCVFLFILNKASSSAAAGRWRRNVQQHSLSEKCVAFSSALRWWLLFRSQVVLGCCDGESSVYINPPWVSDTSSHIAVGQFSSADSKCYSNPRDLLISFCWDWRSIWQTQFYLLIDTSPYSSPGRGPWLDLWLELDMIIDYIQTWKLETRTQTIIIIIRY